MINKGQVLTHYYRIMNKNGGYTWLQTCATVVCSTKNADEQNIICVNYVVSGKEGENYVLDQCQLGIKREPSNVFAKHEHELLPLETTIDQIDNKSKVLPIPQDFVKCDDEENLGKRSRKRKVKNESKNKETSAKCSSLSLSDIPVKQLEHAMTKHLTKSLLADVNNLSTDSLIRQSEAEILHDNRSSQPPSPMPATALLRQLYVNRESVIHATTRPTNFMFSENSYLTPPNDSYESQYLRKPVEAFGGSFVSSYPYPSIDYSNAMTPPSSVSPRDLPNQKPSRGSCEYTKLAAGDNRIQNHSNESNLLPLKPHPYSIHQMDPSYAIDHHQSQYFPYHSGFHLYHKNSHVYSPP